MQAFKRIKAPYTYWIFKKMDFRGACVCVRVYASLCGCNYVWFGCVCVACMSAMCVCPMCISMVCVFSMIVCSVCVCVLGACLGVLYVSGVSVCKFSVFAVWVVCVCLQDVCVCLWDMYVGGVSSVCVHTWCICKWVLCVCGEGVSSGCVCEAHVCICQAVKVLCVGLWVVQVLCVCLQGVHTPTRSGGSKIRRWINTWTQVWRKPGLGSCSLWRDESTPLFQVSLCVKKKKSPAVPGSCEDYHRWWTT